MMSLINIACSILAVAGVNFLIFDRTILGVIFLGVSIGGYLSVIRNIIRTRNILREYFLNLICGVVFFFLSSLLPVKIGEDDLGIGILIVGIIIGYFYIVTFITVIVLILNHIKKFKEKIKGTGEE